MAPLLLLPPPPGRRGACAATALDLPDDVALTIFGHLRDARHIAAARGVCRRWRGLIDRAAAIWRTLVFELPRCARAAEVAETWYRKAADYGNTQAQFMLALLYTYGYGTHRARRSILATGR